MWWRITAGVAVGAFILYGLISGIIWSHRDIVVVPYGLSVADDTLTCLATLRINGTLNLQGGTKLPANRPWLPSWPEMALGDFTEACAYTDSTQPCRWLDNYALGVFRGISVRAVTLVDNRYTPVYPPCLQIATTALDTTVYMVGVNNTFTFINNGTGIRADFCAWWADNPQSAPMFDNLWWKQTNCSTGTGSLGFACSVDRAKDSVYYNCPIPADLYGNHCVVGPSPPPTPPPIPPSCLIPVPLQASPLVLMDQTNYLVAPAANLSYPVLLTLNAVTAPTGTSTFTKLSITLNLAWTMVTTITVVALDGFPLVPPVLLSGTSVTMEITLGSPTLYASWKGSLALELSVVRTLSAWTSVTITPADLTLSTCTGTTQILQDTRLPPAMQSAVTIITRGSPGIDQTLALFWESLFAQDGLPITTYAVSLHTAVAAPDGLTDLISWEYSLTSITHVCSHQWNNTASNRYWVLPTATPAVYFAPVFSIPAVNGDQWTMRIEMPVAECSVWSMIRVRPCGGIYPCTPAAPQPSAPCPIFSGTTATLMRADPIIGLYPAIGLHSPYPFTQVFLGVGSVLTIPSVAPNGLQQLCEYTCNATMADCISLYPLNGGWQTTTTAPLIPWTWTRQVTASPSTTLYTIRWEGFGTTNAVLAPASVDGWSWYVNWSIPLAVDWGPTLPTLLACQIRVLTPDCPAYEQPHDNGGVDYWHQVTSVDTGRGIADTWLPSNQQAWLTTQLQSAGVFPTADFDNSDFFQRYGTPSYLPKAIPADTTALVNTQYAPVVGILFLDATAPATVGDFHTQTSMFIEYPSVWLLENSPELTFLAPIAALNSPVMAASYSLCRILYNINNAGTPMVALFDDDLLAALGGATGVRYGTSTFIHMGFNAFDTADYLNPYQPLYFPLPVLLNYRFLYHNDLPMVADYSRITMKACVAA